MNLHGALFLLAATVACGPAAESAPPAAPTTTDVVPPQPPQPPAPPVASAAPQPPAPPSPPAAPVAASEVEKTYLLVVSFLSKGSGPDRAAEDTLTRILTKWHADKGAKNALWGREGESDVCTDLTEVAAASRSKVVADVRGALGKNDRVKIQESATCHPGR